MPTPWFGYTTFSPTRNSIIPPGNSYYSAIPSLLRYFPHRHTGQPPESTFESQIPPDPLPKIDINELLPRDQPQSGLSRSTSIRPLIPIITHRNQPPTQPVWYRQQ